MFAESTCFSMMFLQVSPIFPIFSLVFVHLLVPSQAAMLPTLAQRFSRLSKAQRWAEALQIFAELQRAEPRQERRRTTGRDGARGSTAGRWTVVKWD